MTKSEARLEIMLFLLELAEAACPDGEWIDVEMEHRLDATDKLLCEQLGLNIDEEPNFSDEAPTPPY